MTILRKVIAIVGVIALTLVITVVPCFALGTGIADAYSSDVMPMYVSSVEYFQYNFANNQMPGVSSGEFVVDFNKSIAFNTASYDTSNRVSVNQGFEDVYDGRIQVTTNTFLLNGAFSDASDIPDFFVSIAPEVLGSAQLAITGYVHHPDNTSTRVYKFVPISSSADSLIGSAFSTQEYLYSALVENRTSLFDVFELTMYFTVDVTGDVYGDVVQAGCAWDAGYSWPNGYSTVVINETVDVLSWLPATIDGFLTTELFPGLSIGTLLTMVIAIPALFAVLKLLGGGG